ncbi:hypothetical protein HU200_006896 [Digitaria exilis]|uniref:RING-type domain-containing protein n=1 Tax=Digitaria exilis TaxID=1010633 RepID=A0A835FNB6_9POAL|nr:hypothetical protein HU200_006896 [Digitaria exilis]
MAVTATTIAAATTMLAAVAAVFLTLVLCFYIFLCAKHYRGGGAPPPPPTGRGGGGGRGGGVADGGAEAWCYDGGLDEKSMAKLPRHEVGKGEVLDDCAVCLTELKAGDTARVLPRCGHGFHVDCVDMWLRSHSTCPLCRCPAVDEPPVPPCSRPCPRRRLTRSHPTSQPTCSSSAPRMRSAPDGRSTSRRRPWRRRLRHRKSMSPSPLLSTRRRGRAGCGG